MSIAYYTIEHDKKYSIIVYMKLEGERIVSAPYTGEDIHKINLDLSDKNTIIINIGAGSVVAIPHSSINYMIYVPFVDPDQPAS
jgi:hypothetical protein